MPSPAGVSAPEMVRPTVQSGSRNLRVKTWQISRSRPRVVAQEGVIDQVGGHFPARDSGGCDSMQTDAFEDNPCSSTLARVVGNGRLR